MRPTQDRQSMRRAPTGGFGLALLTLLATLALAGTAGAATPVPLGGADAFAVLAGTTVTNTGATVVNGDLGISPGSACTGLPAPCTGGGPGTVNGTIHSADAAAGQAQLDLTTAYNNAASQPVTATVGTELGGTTRFPGVYDSAAGDFGITGTLTLDAQGDPNAIFIFKTASTLVTAAENSQVNLINGAQSCNVFWQVGSSATLGTNTLFRGNILALTAISATTGAVVDGRLLARNAAVTMDSNTITRAQCSLPAAPAAPAVPAALPPAPGDAGGPTVTVTEVPKPCVDRNFKVHVTVSDLLGIAGTDVFLDGNRIKRSSKEGFTVKIKAANLPPGKHTIRVVASDAAGNKSARKARFQRCHPVRVTFTG